MLRVLSIAFALLLGSQAAASGSRAMVCRYTGKVMQNCPCPPAPEQAELQKQSCCELRQSLPVHLTAIKATTWEAQRIDLAASASSFLPAPSQLSAAEVSLPEAQAPPDGSDQYLRLRLLLL